MHASTCIITTGAPPRSKSLSHRDFSWLLAPVSSGAPNWEFPVWSRTRPAAAAASDFCGGLLLVRRLNRLTGSRWGSTEILRSGWPIDSQIFSSRQQTANRRSGISQPAAKVTGTCVVVVGRGFIGHRSAYQSTQSQIHTLNLGFAHSHISRMSCRQLLVHTTTQ